MNLVAALRAEDAAVAVVGAGGKKTTMYALARRLDRPVITAAVRIPIFDNDAARVATTDNPVAALKAATDDDFPLGLVAAREREDRYLGYDTEVVADLIDANPGATLIKADGARMRDFKAPKEGEPQIPRNADVVVPVASAHVVGEPLDERLVHRPERVAAVAQAAGVDVAVGEQITPDVVGAVLASRDGGLKDVPAGATAIPLINKVDDEAGAAAAREVAAAFTDHLDAARLADAGVEVPHVVLARMIDAAVVDVVSV
ncbi:selenium cofactor biosynthesis protein YqeC [Halorubrum gandharaense]